MRFSIITVVNNNVDCIECCIKSVIAQSFANLEYIIIDGGSTDGTLEVIDRYKENISRVVSEEDEGYVHAMNKGLKLATGGVIGFLHADDVYASANTINHVATLLEKSHADSIYGDLVYVGKRDTEKVVRYWKGGESDKHKFEWGWMPPHPTFFAKKIVYEKYGYFNTDFKIAADYEIMLRFLYKYGISTYYVPEVLVKMRSGGASNRSFRNIVIKSLEDYKACRIHGIKRKLYAIMLKNMTKLPQFFIGKGKI